jgi:transcription antitermination factor NusG
MDKKWYLVCTKPQREKKLAATLTKKKIENFYPLNRIERMERNKKRVSFEPLFSSYVFVFTSESEMAAIRSIDSVINFVYWLSTPVTFKEDEIETMRSYTTQFSNITLTKTKVEVTGRIEAVREYYRNSTNSQGETVAVMKDNYKLLLPSMGYTLAAERERATNDVFTFGFEGMKMGS